MKVGPIPMPGVPAEPPQPGYVQPVRVSELLDKLEAVPEDRRDDYTVWVRGPDGKLARATIVERGIAGDVGRYLVIDAEAEPS